MRKIEFVKKDLEEKLQLVTNNNLALMNQLEKSEQSIGSLKNRTGKFWKTQRARVRIKLKIRRIPVT